MAFRNMFRAAKRAAPFAAAASVAGFATASPASSAATTVKDLLGQISARLDRIEGTLGISGGFEKELALIKKVKAEQPDNIGMQCFDFDYFDSLSPELKVRMIACARSGFENPDSGMGAYAIQPDDYDVLTPYLDACIR
eukprot:COSAG05_NODE_8884_length_663_cov_1.955752_1_plen_138_part_10